MFESCQNISRRKTQITKQTTLLLKTESQEVIVDVSWSECSNLNVINITISMRYLPVTIILPGLVITTLSTREQRDNRLILEAIFPIRRMRTPLTVVTTFSTSPFRQHGSDLATNQATASSHLILATNQTKVTFLAQMTSSSLSRSMSGVWRSLNWRAGLASVRRKHYQINIKTGNTDFTLTDPPLMQGWKNVLKFSCYRFLLIPNHENCCGE